MLQCFALCCIQFEIIEIESLSDLTCKRGSVGQSEGLSIRRSSVRFRLKLDNSHSHEFELHRPSNKGTKLLLKVIKAIIIITLSLALSLALFLARSLSRSLSQSFSHSLSVFTL